MDPVQIREQQFEYANAGTSNLSQRTGLMHTHPYLFALGSIATLLLIGALLVVRSAPASTGASSTIAWGGTGSVIGPTLAPSDTSSTMTSVQKQPPYDYVLPTLSPASTDATDTQTSSGFDYSAFISSLSQENHPASQAQQTTDGSDAYSFIPTGFISTETPTKRTKTQQAIYDYGNSVGSLVQAFEQQHPAMQQQLTDQLQDRTDPTKAAAVARIGSDLAALGDALLAIDAVPTQMASAHEALASSYKEIGAKLSTVPHTQGDSAFLDAVNAYDAAADTFVHNYVSLAQLFVANGVSFTSADPGNVFTFTTTTGL